MTPHSTPAPTSTTEDQSVSVELIGIPLDGIGRHPRMSEVAPRPVGDTSADRDQLVSELTRTMDLLVEMGRLREMLSATRARVAQLEEEVVRMRSHAEAEGASRAEERAQAHERECDLIRILHRQVIRAQSVDQWVVSLANGSLAIPTDPGSP